jgi:hypothetical protein
VFKSCSCCRTPVSIFWRSSACSGQGYNVHRNPSQIFFTRILSWSPWNKWKSGLIFKLFWKGFFKSKLTLIFLRVV